MADNGFHMNGVSFYRRAVKSLNRPLGADEVVAETVLSVLITMFVLVFGTYCWVNDVHFQVSGFDTGIFSQGTWLLSRFHNPFVTIRGLNLFGDHASYILILVAPLYRLWPDARLLFLLQTFALAIPALAIYRTAVAKIGPWVALALAFVYLMYPTLQWAAIWQFHPETFAAAFLAFAVLAVERGQHRLMAMWIGLALLCKEDVSFVVAGFGALLWLTGKRRVGYTLVGVGIGYFALVTFAITPLINGRGSIYFSRNYGIGTSGPGALLAVPHLIFHAAMTATTDSGLLYLAQVFAPLALLPFVDPKTILPVAGPLTLNLASQLAYQRSTHYQYLITSSPLLVLAALAGLMRIRLSGRSVNCAVVTLVVVMSAMWWTQSPWRTVKGVITQPANQETDASLRAAMALIPANAVVSAQSNIDTALSSRVGIYEFPNPFHATNWGMDDTSLGPKQIDSVQYVIVQGETLNSDWAADFNSLVASPNWEILYESGGVELLHHKTDGQ